MQAHAVRFVVLAATLVASTLVDAGAQAPAASGVSVTATYKGKGVVDGTHEIWVFLFTSPNVDNGSRPVGTQTVTKNGGTASFHGVTSPVYLVMIYDEKGTYDGNSAPPDNGLPVGTYSTDKKAPSAIKPGQKVSATFDGSRRWQGKL